jgi:hypothetical protein
MAFHSNFSGGGGITSLNGLSIPVQTFASGTAGTDFNIVSSGAIHTLNIPSASTLNRGLVTTGGQIFSGVKTFSSFPQAPSATPVGNLDLVPKQYVDLFAQGLTVKESVRVATDSPGTLATDFEDGDTIDGVILATNDRILIKDQVDQSENGIYTVNAIGAPTRALDYDTDAEVKEGTFCAVLLGTTNGNTLWVQTTPSPTINVSPLVFSKLSSTPTTTEPAGSVLFSDGSNITGDNANLFWDNSSKGLGILTDTPINHLDIPGFNNNNSISRIGQLEFSSYGPNNNFIGSNTYYNGGFTHRDDGYIGLFYFIDNEGQFRFSGNAVAGTNAGDITPQLKIHQDGSFAVGSTLPYSVGDFTGANFYWKGDTNQLFIGDITNPASLVNPFIVKGVGISWQETGQAGFSANAYDISAGFGTNTAVFLGRGARGTASIPTGVLTGDALIRFSGAGHDGTTFVVGGDAGFLAAENFTPGANGTDFVMQNARIGAATRTEKLRITAEGVMNHRSFNPSVSTVNDSLIRREQTSAGTVVAGFGSGILTQLRSSTTNDQNASRVSTIWRDATHATKSSSMTWELVNAGGALTEKMRLTGQGRLGIQNTNPGATIHAIDDTNANIFLETASDGTGGNRFVGRRAGGTPASPTNTKTGMVINNFAARGHDGTGYDSIANASIAQFAGEDFSPTNKGTYMTFHTTANGTTAQNERMRITGDGKVGVGTATPATSAILDLTSTTGALLLPRMSTGARDALTAVNGMLIYNTSLNKFQGYENGSWVNLV